MAQQIPAPIRFPTEVGGFTEGLRGGLDIGQSRRQEQRQQVALEFDMQQADEEKQAAQAEAEQKQSMEALDIGFKAYKAANDTGMHNRVKARIWNEQIAPHLDGRGANLDFEGRGNEISTITNKMWDSLKKGNIDVQGMDTLFGDLDKEYSAVSGRVPSLETEAQRGLSAPTVPIPEAQPLAQPPEASQFAFEAAPEPPPKPIETSAADFNVLNDRIISQFISKSKITLKDLISPDAGVNRLSVRKGLSEKDQILMDRTSVLAESFVQAGMPPATAAQQAFKQAQKEVKDQPAGGGALDGATAAQILAEAGGDREKARAIAKQRGFTF